jgi:hypothetical protein
LAVDLLGVRVVQAHEPSPVLCFWSSAPERYIDLPYMARLCP